VRGGEADGKVWSLEFGVVALVIKIIAVCITFE